MMKCRIKGCIFAAVSLWLAGLMLSGCTQEPGCPDSLQAIVTEDNTICLSWNPAADAAGYRIYRRISNERNFKYLTDTQETYYTDTTAIPGKTYDYQVTALGPGGESSGTVYNGAAMPKTIVEAITLSNPKITSVTRLDTFTNVIFFSDENAECEYEILRQDAADSWMVIGKTEDHIYYDGTAAQDGQYSYKVRAVSTAGESAESESTSPDTNPKEVFGVPVLMYHEFVTPEDLDNGIAFDEYAIYYEEFEHDLRWLQDNGYTTITTRELTQYLNGQGELPNKPIILTIDDGKLGVYKNAYPLLQRYDMKAVLAVIGSEIDAATQAPGQRETSPAPYCTWDELADMSASGCVEIASHSYGFHTYQQDGRIGANYDDTENLTKFLLDAYRDTQKFQNCLKSHDIPAAETFSYPYSVRSPESDNTWLRCGYQMLLGGNAESVRHTRINYFIQEAGINNYSALLRRIVRMNGVPIEDYIG